MIKSIYRYDWVTMRWKHTYRWLGRVTVEMPWTARPDGDC